MTVPTLSIRQLSKLFTTRDGSLLVLDGIDMTVAPNEFVCIVGASGCGKSTLLNIVAGLEQPTAGEVSISGRPVDGPGADRGMVFQNYTLYPWLSVAGNVEFGLKLRGLSAAERQARVAEYLDIVGLSRFANAYPRQLSGGMKQRAAIARAMVNEPSILLMDEPFGALDAQTKGNLQEFLLDVLRRTQLTVLMITHDIDEAIYLADRIYVLSSRPGRVVRELVVPFGRDRTRDCRRTAAFQQLSADIYDLLHQRTALAEEVL